MGMFDFLNGNPLSGANSDGFSGLAANPLFAMGMQMLQNSAKQVGGSRPLFEGMLPAMSGAARNSALMQSMKASAQQQEYQKWQMDKAKQDAIAHDSAMSQINAALGAGNDYTRDAGVTNLAMQSEPASTRAMGAPMPPNPLSTDSLIPIMMQDPQMQNSGLQLLMAKAQQQRSQDFLNSLPGGQGTAPGPLSGSTFDPKVYAALKASGDPAQSAYAEVYKEQNLMPAPAAANQAWDRFKYDNPSAIERARLGIDAANLGINQGKLGIDQANLYFNTGLGGPPASAAVPGVTPPAGPTAPLPTGPAPQVSTAPGALPMTPPPAGMNNTPPPAASRPMVPANLPPKTQAEIAAKAAEQAGETQAKLRQELPKAKGAYEQTMMGLKEMENTIYRLAGEPVTDAQGRQAVDKYGVPVLPGTPGLSAITGPINGRTPNVFEKANNAQANLDELSSKILINTLMSMKSLSENGASGFGALNKDEGDALRASVASLKQSQGTPQFANKLGILLQHVKQMQNNISGTYQQTYAPLEGGSAPGVKFLGFE